MSVDFEEMHGSPTESRDREGVRATRRLKCKWGDRWRLVNLLLAGIGSPYPHFPMARARRAAPAPFEAKQIGSGSIAAYEFAIVTVEYETPRPGTVEDPEELASERLSAAGEFITVAVEDSAEQPLLVWSDDTALSPDEAPGKIVRFLEYELSLFEVAQVPDAAYNLLGKVNDAPVAARLLGKTFEAETLLYNSINPERSITAEGASRWTTNFSFSYNPEGWNKVWRAKSGQYERMHIANLNASGAVQAGDEYDLFTPADFTQL